MDSHTGSTPIHYFLSQIFLLSIIRERTHGSSFTHTVYTISKHLKGDNNQPFWSINLLTATRQWTIKNCNLDHLTIHIG